MQFISAHANSIQFVVGGHALSEQWPLRGHCSDRGQPPTTNTSQFNFISIQLNSVQSNPTQVNSVQSNSFQFNLFVVSGRVMNSGPQGPLFANNQILILILILILIVLMLISIIVILILIHMNIHTNSNINANTNDVDADTKIYIFVFVVRFVCRSRLRPERWPLRGHCSDIVGLSQTRQFVLSKQDKENTFFALVLGAHLKLVLGLFGFGLDSVSFRFGFVLGSVSIPLGFILDSISIRCMHIVSDVWDSISAIWN